MRPKVRRRALLLAALGSAGMGSQAANIAPAVSPTRASEPRMVFPRDFGSHPATATEWWYVTGYATDAQNDLWGFQVTFFRSRVPGTQAMKSTFAARQILFAHAAVTDVRGKRLLHDQRIGRSAGTASTSGARASEKDTNIHLRDWSLIRSNGVYQATVLSDGFQLNLQFRETQAVLLQGDKGLSRKGPLPQQTSLYYSKPQLSVQGTMALPAQTIAVKSGTAWLDHEWSDEMLPEGAVGWDWIGMNLFDGSALTAFRVRDKAGNAVWDGGSFRHPKMEPPDKPHLFSRGEVLFQASRGWKSPLTQARYPVEWLVRTPADYYIVKALVDNQELDSRTSTGAVYWEGLADLYDSNNHLVGRGYLEMTGYAQPLRM